MAHGHSSVTVYSDKNLVTYVLSAAKLNATVHRWVSELADFNLPLKYIKVQYSLQLKITRH